MLQITLSHEPQFSFPGPNLTFLGTTDDFRQLAQETVRLTSGTGYAEINLNALPFCNVADPGIVVKFKNTPNKVDLAFVDQNIVIFDLDSKFWDRLFRFFVLMSWSKSTYYLNVDDSSISDLNLIQDAYFICSSEF